MKNCPWKSVSVRKASVKKSTILHDFLQASMWCPWENHKFSVKSVSVHEVSVRKSKNVREILWGICEKIKIVFEVQEYPWGIREKIKNCGSLWTSVRCLWVNQKLVMINRERPWGICEKIKNHSWMSVSVHEVSVRKSKIVREILLVFVRCPWENRKLVVNDRERPWVVWKKT